MQYLIMVTYPDIGDTNYFTNRALENKAGEKKGKIIMWRNKGKEEFHMILTCPECGEVTEKKQAFEKKPYRPNCDSCGAKFVIAKLKADKKKK